MIDQHANTCYTHTHTHMHTYMQTRVHAHIYTCARTHTCTHIRKHVHMHALFVAQRKFHPQASVLEDLRFNSMSQQHLP